ncbi:unnamed protein product (macronuclear) [Paramecium tetraurelia]|uniref:Transmembrane protein n=1 Tax=Paramecium tetraurelia TaxID=5888 RepID=A0CVT3_PARTE|nr:uncharacterized protein GSPATT00039061001 [Paramecium tetraurelia]CAK74900.1 unnamed protein product [Paramecium tetraurelia]|eukprot:XP_001442297.1 hypothetical protein (macronuclear) [Paramecium tetraurelia strain d4-2]
MTFQIFILQKIQNHIYLLAIITGTPKILYLTNQFRKFESKNNYTKEIKLTMMSKIIQQLKNNQYQFKSKACYNKTDSNNIKQKMLREKKLQNKKQGVGAEKVMQFGQSLIESLWQFLNNNFALI